MEGVVNKIPIKGSKATVGRTIWKNKYLVFEDGVMHEYRDSTKKKKSPKQLLEVMKTSKVLEMPDEVDRKFLFLVVFNNNVEMKYSVDNALQKKRWLEALKEYIESKKQEEVALKSVVPILSDSKFNLLYDSKNTVNMLVSEGMLSTKYKAVQLLLFPGRLAFVLNENWGVEDFDHCVQVAYDNSLQMVDGVEANGDFSVTELKSGDYQFANTKTNESFIVNFSDATDLAALNAALLRDKEKSYLSFPNDVKGDRSFALKLKPFLAEAITSDESLRTWYYNAVNKDALAVEIMNQAYIQYCIKIVPKLQPSTNDAPVFIRFLSELAAGQVVFILFFCFDFTADFMAEFAAEQKIAHKRPDQIFDAFLSAVVKASQSAAWLVNLQLLLFLFSHPACRSNGTKVKTPVTDSEFQQWYENTLCNVSKQTMSWLSFGQLLTNPPYCAYILMRHAADFLDAQMVLDAFAFIPDSVISAEFDVPTMGLVDGPTPVAKARAPSPPVITVFPVPAGSEELGDGTVVLEVGAEITLGAASTETDTAKPVPDEAEKDKEVSNEKVMGVICDVRKHFIQLLFAPNLRDCVEDLAVIYHDKNLFDDRVVGEFFTEAIVPSRIEIATKVAEEVLMDKHTGIASETVMAYPHAAVNIFTALQKALAGPDGSKLVVHNSCKVLVQRLASFEVIKFDLPNFTHVETISKKMTQDAKLRTAILPLLDTIKFGTFLSEYVFKALPLYVTGNISPHSSRRTTMSEVPLNPDELLVKNVCDTIYGFLVLFYEANKPEDVEAQTVLRVFFLNMKREFFNRFFGPNEILRKRVIQYLLEKFHIRQVFIRSMKDNKLLIRAEHFEESVLKCFALPLSNLSDAFSHSLTMAALGIEEFENLEAKIKTIDEDSGKYHQRAKQLEMIIAAVHKRDPKEFLDDKVVLSDLVACAQYAADALKVLSYMPTAHGSNMLKQMFERYLSSMLPGTWKPMFKSAETIAFFIKYLDRENLKRCYAQFEDRNRDNEPLKEILKGVKERYPKPLVKPKDFSIGETAIDNFIQDLLESAKNPEKTPEMQILTEICARWMINRNEIVKIPMAPRNTQMVLTMVVIEWFKRLTPESQKRALIAQVGTGEGKSLIIAMLCIYLVKGLKQKVHVLENNIGLLKRDYASFTAFYQQFGITTGACELGNASASTKFLDCDVCYCLRGAMESFYREQIFAGKKPFENTVLIVDEVDELIVDDSPNQRYVKPDAELSALVPTYFDLLRKTGGRGPAPSSAADFNKTLWDQASSAYRVAQGKKEGVGANGYVLTDENGYCMTDERGRVKSNSYALWLEYIRYTKDSSYSPELMSGFFYQSMPYMMAQYGSIVGLSGSLGSPAEKEFLDKTYGTWNIDVPPFLDTCDGVSKEKLALIDNCVYVFQDRAEQYKKAATLAMNMSKTVPILLIMKNPEEVEAMHDALKRNGVSEDAVQLFLQYYQGKIQPWDSIVEKATRPLSESNNYRVTVTDYWGGRGHDYRINDDEVNERGGMGIIMTTFPDSEREWIQWKGRTARNDRRGQYSVILNHSDIPATSGSEDSLLEQFKLSAPNTYSVGIIEELAKSGDKKIQEKMNANADEVVAGQRVNELCDAFYAVHKSLDSSVFPANPEQGKLRDFLDGGKFDKQSVISFYLSVGLIKSRSEYVSKY